jgi:hypothetical protein
LEKNYSTQLAGQIGESLTVAELGRRGIVATAFAGNVPEIDLLAYKDGTTISLQVKAWRVGSVSFDAKNYLEIEFVDKQQNVVGLHNFGNENLIYVFVKIGEKIGSDKFFVLSKRILANMIMENYVSFLSKHNGQRPRNYLTRVQTHNQNMTVAASAIAERKTFGHLS